MARKISLNSAYGAIGNEWFRYYDLRIAEGITTSGQLSIRWIEKSLNLYLNKLLKTEGEDYVIASDTDSVYITFDKLVEDLNRDCDGEWGDCDQNTCNQTYTITTQSKGNGAKCPNKNGDTQTCSTGLCKDTTCDENGKSKNSKFC